MDDEEKSGEPAEFTRKYECAPVFSVPVEPWRIGALWEDAYFDSAKYVMEGVLKRQLTPSVHGVAGVFLLRHYLEISRSSSSSCTRAGSPITAGSRGRKRSRMSRRRIG
jgi:hypothetical protein